MNESTTKGTKGKTINEDGSEVLDPRKAMQEQTLAVDLARVELDHQIATAHKFPRIIDTVIKKIGTLACYNKDSAESCVYALPRAGKPIIGPSIGFANIVMQAWGNCRVGSRITYIDIKQKVVIAEGIFLDLESNSQSIVPVNRRIVDSKGRLYSEDMQIITGMAAASIGRRNSVLQGVPRGLWHPIFLDALGIVRGSVETFAENKDKAFKALAQFGVTPAMVVLYLGLKGEVDLTYEHIPTLRGMYQQLRDGMITVEQMFDPRRMTGKGFETVENPLGDGENDDDEATGGDETASMGEAPIMAQGTRSEPVAGSQLKPDLKSTAAAAQPRPPVAQNGTAGPKVAPAEQTAQAAAAEPSSTGSETAPAAAQSAADAQQATGQDDGQPRAPTTAEEYADHWEAFCARAKSAMEVKDRWGAERALRTMCGLMGAEFDRVKQQNDDAQKRLRK